MDTTKRGWGLYLPEIEVLFSIYIQAKAIFDRRGNSKDMMHGYRVFGNFAHVAIYAKRAFPLIIAS